MSLRAVIVRDYDQMGAVAAEFVEQQLARVLAVRPTASLGLAAGKAPGGTNPGLAAATGLLARRGRIAARGIPPADRSA